MIGPSAHVGDDFEQDGRAVEHDGHDVGRLTFRGA
jgi:hypothetical protein